MAIAAAETVRRPPPRPDLQAKFHQGGRRLDLGGDLEQSRQLAEDYRLFAVRAYSLEMTGKRARSGRISCRRPHSFDLRQQRSLNRRGARADKA